jgi:hypothetical protein
MVSREESRQEHPSATERSEERRPAGAAAGIEPSVAGFQKCPYLAGRPPCGTHYLFPSGTNVCWAEPGDDKPYRGISRDTQSTHCFSGPDGPSECQRYRRAVAEARPLPRFENRLPSARTMPEGLTPPRPTAEPARFLRLSAWLLPLCLTVLLVLLMLR